MTDTTTRFPVRQGRNIAAIIVLVPLTIAALAVGIQQGDLGLDDWWILVFPVLTAMTAYRLIRRRTPLVMDSSGLQVATGHTLLGLRTKVPWSEVKRIRVTAGGLLLVEMSNAERWAADKPWLVRANVRANERKTQAAIVQPLRELAGEPEQIVPALQAASPVRVDAPEALRGRP